MGFGLPASDSVKTMGGEPQNVGAGKMAGGGCSTGHWEKMNVEYNRIKAIRIPQTQGARVGGGSSPEYLLDELSDNRAWRKEIFSANG